MCDSTLSILTRTWLNDVCIYVFLEEKATMTGIVLFLCWPKIKDKYWKCLPATAIHYVRNSPVLAGRAMEGNSLL